MTNFDTYFEWFKINCDRAYDPNIARAGVVVRNSDGVLIDGTNRYFITASVILAKAISLKDGINLTVKAINEPSQV